MASIGDSQPRPKQHAVHVLRSLGLLGSVEWLNRRWAIAKSNADNDRFCREHSDFVPPPLAAMHDCLGGRVTEARARHAASAAAGCRR
jgi:hypothetical protein